MAKDKDYEAYRKRAEELDRRIAEGETITEILEAEQLAKGKALIEKIAKEGW